MAAKDLVLSDNALIRNLDWLRAGWQGKLFVGLMQNEQDPEDWWTITQIQPAVFSGYDGVHEIRLWQPATLAGHIATTKAQTNVWEHSGGDVSGWVSGYYVVDETGAYMWAARRPGPPAAMIYAGNQYTVTPVYSIRSRYS